MPLESGFEQYPKAIKLKSGIACTLRPVTAEDQEDFRVFFSSLPSEDLLYMKERITDPEVCRKWFENLEQGRNAALLAVQDKKILAMGMLERHFGGWKRQIGHINVHTCSEYRGKGFGRMMISELIDIARGAGLDRLEAELLDKQVGAIKMFGLLGFSTLVSLPDYVKDMRAVSHDYILMGIKLTTEEEYAGMG